MLIRQVLTIAGTDDLLGWILPKKPGSEGHAHGNRFQGTRRQINNEPLGTTQPAIFKPCSQQLDIWAM